MDETGLVDEFNPDRIFSAVREEESLFARGDDDALIRYVKPSQKQFEEQVTLLIDGEMVKVPKAKPLTDALGNLRKGPDGLPIPRATTIYDAAVELVQQGKFTGVDLSERIPILCHQQHLNPVAVCRMCSVHISSIKRGKFTGGRKLVPACQHRVEDKMAVISRKGPRDIGQFLKVLADEFKVKSDDLPREQSVTGYKKMVEESTRFLSELLVADHLHPDPERDTLYRNELRQVASHMNVAVADVRCSVNPGRSDGRNFNLHEKSRPIHSTGIDRARSESTALPYSSRSIQVDHDRCILCDRCVRSCSEVKPFKVIGHTGKGYLSRISFDLDQIMNQSSCVQCGECMSACPTGALTLNRRVSPQSWPDKPKISTDPSEPLPKGFLSADEMIQVELFHENEGVRRSFFPFRDISYPYLRWNEGAVRRRELRPGDVLCNQGDFGSTAFLLVKGEFQVSIDAAGGYDDRATGFWNWLRGGGRGARGKNPFAPITLNAQRDLILGEIACLTNDKRTATVTATTDAVVLEVTRNMLTMLQRNPAARRVLDTIFRQRAIRTCLNQSELFQSLRPEQRSTLVAEFQKDAQVLHVEPGEVIVAEGDAIGLDKEGTRFLGDFYIVLLGYVKVSCKFQNQERVLNYLQPNQHFGEIALLPDHPLVVAAQRERGINPSQRTATCAALGDVEVVRIPGATFRRFFRYEPKQEKRTEFTQIAERLAAGAVKMLGEHQAPPALEQDRLGEFLRQGLYQSQKMLVLDLECCTRCDECTRACADAHGDGHSRLLREGLRFGSFLVAASCRSCHQPYCMDGCPVDAIHRDAKSLEILIENHCIGCSLCEKNCPYGSIQMVPKEGGRWSDLLVDVEQPKMIAEVARKAVNCDLCHGLVKPGQDPFCVSACPHEAAFRWSGEELMQEVKDRGA